MFCFSSTAFSAAVDSADQQKAVKNTLFLNDICPNDIYIYILLTCDRVVYALKFDGFQEKNIHEFNIIICKNALEPMGMVVQIVPPPKKPDSRPFFDKCFV